MARRWSSRREVEPGSVRVAAEGNGSGKIRASRRSRRAVRPGLRRSRGGAAVAEQRRGSAGVSGAAARVRGAAREWIGCRAAAVGANKGQAGDLGDACLAGPRRKSRWFPLSARGGCGRKGTALACGAGLAVAGRVKRGCRPSAWALGVSVGRGD